MLCQIPASTNRGLPDSSGGSGPQVGSGESPSGLASDSDSRSEPREATISAALAPLREVVASLVRAQAGHLPTGTERQRLVRRARRAGPAVLPSLLRSLAGESESAAAWAHCLLRGVAADADSPVRQRTLAQCKRLLVDARKSDQVKARVLALLSDLGAPLGEQVVLHDPEALLARSVRELLSGLESENELGQALDLIFTQVPADELHSFLGEVARHGGALARPLFSALISDPRLPPEVARVFMAQYRPVRPPPRVDAPAPRRARTARERMQARLRQAVRLLHEGELDRARARLHRLLSEFTDEPQIHSALGLCLLRLHEPQQALPHLERARELEPTVAAHAWNLATAAQAAQQLATCYRSLHRYLDQHDGDEGAELRRRTAESFCHSYEQAVSAEYPGTPIEQVLCGEELFERAYAALRAAHYAEAIRGFEEVLQLLPRHHASWGNLGVAYQAQRQTHQAVRCWRQALRLNPNYALAQKNLSLIERH
jgi:tetratricopeptide (TPR) repeat protein